MKKKFFFALSLILATTAIISCRQEDKKSVNQYVNPFVGTAYTGHTYPGATYPFGFMQPGPQTGNFEWDYCAGYRYEDSVIWGFSQNRLNGTGIPDLSDLLMMPFSGAPKNNRDYRSAFSKDSEKASPGYYAVSLTDNAVYVELTATAHVAMHRYTFGEDNSGLYINFQSAQTGSEKEYNNRVLSAEINMEDNQTITGHHRVKGWTDRQLFYVIKFDKPFVSKEELQMNEGNKAPAVIFRFNSKKGDTLQVKVAVSTVSIDGAKKNMASEQNGWDFDQVRKSTAKVWEQMLSRIEVKGDDVQKQNFYTSMYHLLIQPHNIADVDGYYRGADDSVAQSPFGKYYSTFSLWDTFRAAHPLYLFVAPEYVGDIINSMLLHAETYGALPIWALWGHETYCMIGNHGVPPVVEACLKDVPGIDQERAYRLVKQSLTGNNPKYNPEIYDKFGYFPYDLVKEESVSRTLECGFDDYCAALLAKKLNKQEDYEFFMKRSMYYKNLFDPESKLMRGKDSKGQWRTPFDKFALSHAGTAGGDYTEGNAWQYTWHVLQDIDGLVELMGGKEAFAAKLDSLFILDTKTEGAGFISDVTGLIGQYAHGNEPSHHVIYLYSMIGKKERTEELVREVFDKFYKPVPDGLCGNDDCGQMSAWYIFSALGFYPVNPVSGEYVIGAPQIPQATLHLSDNKTFTIIAKNLSPENKYVKSVKLNDVEIKNQRITYRQIMQGGTLIFEMKK